MARCGSLSSTVLRAILLSAGRAVAYLRTSFRMPPLSRERKAAAWSWRRALDGVRGVVRNEQRFIAARIATKTPIRSSPGRSGLRGYTHCSSADKRLHRWNMVAVAEERLISALGRPFRDHRCRDVDRNCARYDRHGVGFQIRRSHHFGLSLHSLGTRSRCPPLVALRATEGQSKLAQPRRGSLVIAIFARGVTIPG